MTTLLKDRIARRMASFQDSGLMRVLRSPHGVDLSSNDYLGFSRHPAILRNMADAVWRDGSGSTGSRLLRGERERISALERRFAQFKNSEAALYFTCGYMANLAVLSTFPEPVDVVFSDSLNHASIIDGIRLGRANRVIFRHSDTADLRSAIASTATTGQRFIVTESVFSMDGDFAPLEEYAQIAEDTGCLLIVDEAHAVGIFGKRGSGLMPQKSAFLSVNPMGKAFGVAGAFVCGPAWAIDYMVQRTRPFIFSTAAPPPVTAALESALELMESAAGEIRARVLHLAGFLRALLADGGLEVAREGSQIIPILIGGNCEASAAAASLQEAGFDVRSIRPPAMPEGTARLRLSVNAGLDEDILRDFAGALLAATGNRSV